MFLAMSAISVVGINLFILDVRGECFVRSLRIMQLLSR